MRPLLIAAALAAALSLRPARADQLGNLAPVIVVVIAVPIALVHLPAIGSTAYYWSQGKPERLGWSLYNVTVGGVSAFAGAVWLANTLGHPSPPALDLALPGTLLAVGGIEAGYAIYSLLSDSPGGGGDGRLRIGLSPRGLALSGAF